MFPTFEDNQYRKSSSGYRCPSVVSVDHTERLMRRLYDVELSVASQDYSILFADGPLSNRRARAEVAQMMFETFDIPAFHIKSQPVLSLFSCGRMTGVSVDCGHSHTSVVPVVNGSPVDDCALKLDVSGYAITQYLSDLLADRGSYQKGLQLSSPVVRDIKEKLCYCPVDLASELRLLKARHNEMTYVLPDGNRMTVGSERCRSTEILFQPHLSGSHGRSLHHGIFAAINSCDSKIRKDLASNIVLSGGTSLTSGFAARLTKELTSIMSVNHNTKIKVVNPENRHYSAWSGGAMLASIESFSDVCVKRFEYDEYGPNIVHSKCQ